MDDAWVKVDIFTTSEGVEYLSGVLFEMGHHSISVVDAADLEKLMDGKYGAWDYIDPELMKLREAETTITLYITTDEIESEKLIELQKMLAKIKISDTDGMYGRMECRVTYIKDENWDETWKDNYNPVLVGEKLLICPSWVACDPFGRILIKIDPGMAFGTGLDETTRLCLEALEETIKPGDTFFDIGCGSGILSIAAILLGASSAFGVDLDEIAIKTAKENAVHNGVSNKSEFMCANVTRGQAPVMTGACPLVTYDIVCANIAADIIIELVPFFQKTMNPDSTLIISGIIKDRKQDVANALSDKNFSVMEYNEKNEWTCIIATIL